MTEGDIKAIGSMTAEHASKDMCLHVAELIGRKLTDKEESDIDVKVQFWFGVGLFNGQEAAFKTVLERLQEKLQRKNSCS